MNIHKVYTFKCDMCKKLFQYDEPGEPLCTGPGETLDTHELTMMKLVSLNSTEINPIVAQQRAKGPLIQLLTKHDLEFHADTKIPIVKYHFDIADQI